MCRRYCRNGHCPVGEKCQFAHGSGELRFRRLQATYKTQTCRVFQKKGHCKFGTRCKFLHDERELSLEGERLLVDRRSVRSVANWDKNAEDKPGMVAVRTLDLQHATKTDLEIQLSEAARLLLESTRRLPNREWLAKIAIPHLPEASTLSPLPTLPTLSTLNPYAPVFHHSSDMSPSVSPPPPVLPVLPVPRARLRPSCSRLVRRHERILQIRPFIKYPDPV